MPAALQINGAQSAKPVKFGELYTGRFFTGLWTNRSPLRDAATPQIYEKFYGNRGDNMIAGSNVEVSNRLTVIRRPGNPIYDNVNVFSNIDSFDTFRVDKALVDVFGSPTESIFTMVDTTTPVTGGGALYAENSSNALQAGDTATTVLTKGAGAGQAFMKQVGNQLYFGDGVDNKKWSQSLFVRHSGNNSTPVNINAYPFMTTFLNDPNHNMEQMIGVWVADITNVALVGEQLTLTVSSFGGAAPYNVQPVGTQFMIWNMATATWLNGATITLTAAYTTGGATITGTWTGQHADYSASDTGYLQANPNFQYDTTITTPVPGVSGAPITGGSVPTWGTTVPSSSNDFYGSTTLDGNILWQNRGASTQNWGLNPPTGSLSVNVSGAAASWAKNTYYSQASVFLDPANYLWQVTTAGTTGGTQPVWDTPSPTARAVVEIVNVQVNGSNVAFFRTVTQSPLLVAGDTVQIQNLGVSTFLNGQTVTVSGTGLSSTSFQATIPAHSAVGPYDDNGVAYSVTGSQAPSIKTDGSVVWTCIQAPTGRFSATMGWQAHQHYYEGDFINTPIGGNNNVFRLSKRNPTVTGQQGQPRLWSNPTESYSTSVNAVNVDVFNGTHHGTNGAFDLFHASYPSPDSTKKTNTLAWSNPDFPHGTNGNTFGNDTAFLNLNGAGEVTGVTDTGLYENWEAAITTNIYIPFAGNYQFTLTHDDGAFFAFASTSNDGAGTASLVSGTLTDPFNHTITAKKGYTGLVGNNNSSAGEPQVAWVDTAVWSFSAPGSYEVEIDWTNWQHASKMILTSNSVQLPNCYTSAGDISAGTSPSFGTTPFTTTGAQWDAANSRIIMGSGGSIQETKQSNYNIAGGSGAIASQGSKNYTWTNLGPLSDFVWAASTAYTLPGTAIIDPLGNEEGPIETGVSGATRPTFAATLNSITPDQTPLKWINEGPVATTTTAGKITALSAQGWIYAIALVNTQDNTVSNIGPILSNGPGTNGGTGPVANGKIVFTPADGLPTNLASIDPQADYVAIFRTADGFTTGLLVPSDGNTIYTVPLTQYIQSGYVDTTPDADLDNLIQAAAAGENTPPLPGAANLAFHLNRLWYSIGNTVYYTAGPLAPSGNGVNGADPISNRDTMPSIVKRLVPYTQGVIVFCVSDIYVIQTSGQTVYPSIPFAPGIGLLSYNALDTNGTEVGFFSTDRQFLLMQTQGGLGHHGFPIADQLQLNNGAPGTSWNPANVYVANYQFGQDSGWFIADGVNGWFKLITTPAPDGPPNATGMTWSPFATIASTGAVKAIKSAETSPGQHSLLLGPAGAGVKVLARDVNATTDGGTAEGNGATYSAYMVFGSYVLAHPGQIAQVAFVTTDSVRVGSPLTIGLLIDEALPYYKQSFEILKDWTIDPPGLPASKSFYGQRFYLSELPESSAACRHLQVLVQWPPEAAPNELQSFTIFGCYVQEQ